MSRGACRPHNGSTNVKEKNDCLHNGKVNERAHKECEVGKKGEQRGRSAQDKLVDEARGGRPGRCPRATVAPLFPVCDALGP